MRNKRRVTVFSALCILLLAVAWACSKGKKENDAEKGTLEPVLSVSALLAKAEGRAIERTVETTGTLDASEEAVVGSEVPGTVEKLLVDLGDKVEAGDVMAIIDQREAELNIRDAAAALDAAEKTVEKERARREDSSSNLKRYEGLFKEALVSQAQFDGVKTQSEVAAASYNEALSRQGGAKARLSMSRKKFSDTVIKAPISGTVSKRFISVGEVIRDKSPVFKLVSSRSLKLRGTIPEAFVPLVLQGQEITVTVAAYRDRQFKGMIKRVGAEVNPATRSLDIEALVPNPDSALKPGFFAKGLIITGKDESVPFVPAGAVYSFAGVTKVFVIKDGVLSERLVKTGVRHGDLVEVMGDVKPGDTVAVSNLLNLFDGAKLKPVVNSRD
ncbi:MAG: efflux RND transporter periplasmic adaptor subunit [Deltaproteobacteria bacterium]|nr:efflux RND transporter periplasmic adaptor subunit [Deltaproteobacteria bacterium]